VPLRVSESARFFRLTLYTCFGDPDPMNMLVFAPFAAAPSQLPRINNALRYLSMPQGVSRIIGKPAEVRSPSLPGGDVHTRTEALAIIGRLLYSRSS